MTIDNYERRFFQNMMMDETKERSALKGIDTIKNCDGVPIARVYGSRGKSQEAMVAFFKTQVLGVTKTKESVDCFFDKDNNLLRFGKGRIEVEVILKDVNEGLRTTLNICGKNEAEITSNITGARKIRNTQKRQI